MGIPLVPQLLRAHLAELAENDERHDGRAQDRHRDGRCRREAPALRRCPTDCGPRQHERQGRHYATPVGTETC